MPGTETAAVARSFAEASRVAMLDLLLDGRDHSLGSLARAADIAVSTAAGHLDRLERADIVTSRRVGRERLVRLGGPDVAEAFEALAKLAGDEHVNSLRAWNRREELREARTCYDHLAGRLGLALADAAVAANAVNDEFSLGPRAEDWFGRLGVDVGSLLRGRRPLLRVCTDWTERREHLAGALGAALCSAVLDAGWAACRPASRALSITPLGKTELRELGVTF